MINKENILNESRDYLVTIVEKAKSEAERVRNSILKLRQRLRIAISTDGMIESAILANNLEREGQLEQVVGSPYFVRCDLRVGGEKEIKEFYFGKFQLSEANIYSWISPAAQMRFADIGPIKYRLPGDKASNGELVRKDQFMIVGGQIKFLASEATDYPRTLIYQDVLSGKKSGFVLPEIIAKMEKAQDEVIRAEHKNSFLISGPAGSGKTTLAFHRIAYLTQSPDTAKFYPGWNIIVFVQDEATKKYFSAILPQLGIEEVRVTTFEQWALEVLNISDYKFISRYGHTEEERDFFEYYKNSALKNWRSGKNSAVDIGDVLAGVYDNLPPAYQELSQEQLVAKQLDRFDLTVLLKNAFDKDGGIFINKRVVTEDRKGKLKLENKKIPLAYSFIVIDEAENYLGEQIALLKSCANANQSVLYVGDLAQQTKLCTIKNWNEAGEDFSQDRRVLLDKVYRNTWEILNYIRGLGYDVAIPPDLKRGSPVVEGKYTNSSEASEYINKLIASNPDEVVGVLYRTEDADNIAGLGLQESDTLKLMTFNESQGVEFEIVVVLEFVGKENDRTAYPEELRREKEKVERDLWYMTLTRSMNQLHVLQIG